ncbi:MAG: hypothetical protein ACFBZ8_06560 [Opitutales bacterium]
MLTTSLCATSPAFVWWEAEDFETSTNVEVQEHAPDSEYGSVLSEHTLIEAANTNAAEKLTASYTQRVPSAGKWDLWVRKFWKHGPFKWRINDGDWQTCGRDIALHSDSYILKFIGTNWVYLGEVELEAGEFTFAIESLDNKGFFDCFLLIDGPFQPAGRLKPGIRSGEAEDGHFAWEPPTDPFGPESLIDLRHLNESEAGINGHVRRKGDHFVLGDGTPVKFWTTQATALMPMKPKMKDVHARRLAKYGVNLARLEFLHAFKIWRSGDQEAFAVQLDKIHRTFAALKAQGIYVYFGHLFWDTHVTALSDVDLPGLKKGQKTTGALFVNEPLQAKYLEWVRALMTPVNPYTGLSLAEDPALAIIEIQNESNLLFWTMNPAQLPKTTRTYLQEAFGEFAKERYGSIEKAIEHWGEPIEGDDPAHGKAGLLGAWHMTNAGYDANPARMADQIELLAGLQFQLNAKMKQAFRDMGIQALVAGSNWKTADPSTLGPLEHHSYTAVDMICRNEYFSPISIENERTYAVDVGDAFGPISAFLAPEAAGPLMTNQLVDFPYLITENNWDTPNPYRVEWPFLVATYGSMAGVDAWSFFAYDTPMWRTTFDVWDISTPMTLGQFPAYALMYRRGDVVSGEPAVLEHKPLQELYQNKPVALPEIQFKDAVWKNTLGGDPTVEFESKVNPRAFFAGPVRLNLTADESQLETADLDKLINEQRKRIQNTNGQLVWDYRKGFATVDTPTSKGACGFLKKAGRVRLGFVVIEADNHYGAITLVSLDGKPLEASERILIQAGTREQPFGFETVKEGAHGRRITSVGGYPMNVEKIDATVAIKGFAGRKVTALDALGYPTDRIVQTQETNGNLIIKLPADTLYTVIE